MASARSDKQFAHVCLWPIYLCACVSQRIPLTHVFQGWCRNLHTYFIASMKANELQISCGINAKKFLRENLRMQNPETVQTTHIQEVFFFLKTLNSQEKRPPYGHACCCVNQKEKKKCCISDFTHLTRPQCVIMCHIEMCELSLDCETC